jgi:hypothetical protein
MTELCQRCGRNPVATLEPPDFPFCESCWPVVSSQGNYFVDEDGNFASFMSEAEIAESHRQAGEAALAMAEDEEAAP